MSTIPSYKVKVIFECGHYGEHVDRSTLFTRLAPCSGLPFGRSIEIVHIREDQPRFAGRSMQREGELSYVAGCVSVAVRTYDVGDITFGGKTE